MTSVRLLAPYFVAIYSVVISKRVLAGSYEPFFNENGTAVCGAGETVPQLGAMSSGACVTSPISCAFSCQEDIPGCTAFNYYQPSGDCDFFVGSTVNVTVTPGCVLLAVWNISFCKKYPLKDIFSDCRFKKLKRYKLEYTFIK